MNAGNSPLLAAASLLIATVACPLAATADDHSARLDELSDLRTPEGTGPYPLVAIVPGCSGFKWPFYERARTRLHDLGFATARVDYVAARDLGGCSDEVSNDQVAEDVLFVLTSLANQSEIKAEAMNVLAWSSGGGGALQILSRLGSRPDVSVASIAAYSPQCFGVEPWSAEVPVLMLLGTKDVIAPARYCRNLSEANTVGDEIRVEEYAEAYHGFDDSDLSSSSGNMRYNADAAENAWAKLFGFLVR
jgi:dienelactone hydrolase